MINIAELLKDAPKGMKLYSPLFGDVKLDNAGGMIYVTTKYGSSKCFTETGCYYVDNETFSTECLLFPSKDCRTWEGWKAPVEPKFKVGDWVVRGKGFVYEPSLITEIRDYYICELLNGERVTYTLNDVHKNFHLWTIADAKDGDVLATDNSWSCIFKVFDGCAFSSYCFMDSQRWFCESGSEVHTLDSSINGKIHPATKEQRDLFFKKMREAGYQWDDEKKELLKIQPHYDIANFKPFDKVLGRNCCRSGVWRADYFSHIHKNGKLFVGIGYTWEQCIPFNDDTKHLLGTTDICDEQYKNW